MPAEYRTKQVTLTQNEWTEICHLRPNGPSVEIQNKADDTFQLFVGHSPHALTLDGTDDYVTLASTVFTAIETIFKDLECSEIGIEFNQGTLALAGLITFSKASTATDYLNLCILLDGRAEATLVIDSTVQWTLRSNNAIEAGKEAIVRLWHDGYRPHLQVNENAIAGDHFTVETTPASWLDTLLTGDVPDKIDIGCREIGAGRADFLTGNVHGWWFGTMGPGSPELRWTLDKANQGAATYIKDDRGAYQANFLGSGEPAWGNKESGKRIQAQAEWVPLHEDTPPGKVWGLTTAAGHTVDVIQPGSRPGD